MTADARGLILPEDAAVPLVQGAPADGTPSDRAYRERLADLRGLFAPGSLDARALAQLPRGHECDRLVAHLITRVSPTVTVRALFADEVGGAARDEGSALALATGVTFEHVLLRNSAALLFAMYRRVGRLNDADIGFVNVEALASGIDPASQAERGRITRALLDRKRAGDPTAPAIIWHPRLTCVVDGQVEVFEPDVLVASVADTFYRPGEVKSYRDRGPRTNPSDIDVARRQGAVEVLALRDTLRQMGAGATAEIEALVPARFDLILRTRLGMHPSLREVAIDREVGQMGRLLAGLRGRMLRILDTLPAGTALDTVAGQDSLANRFTESCREHCPHAARCEAKAREAGVPVVLGRAMEEAVGVSMSLHRLAALVSGRDVPVTDGERRLMAEFRAAAVIAARETRRAGGAPTAALGAWGEASDAVTEVRRAG